MGLGGNGPTVGGYSRRLEPQSADSGRLRAGDTRYPHRHSGSDAGLPRIIQQRSAIRRHRRSCGTTNYFDRNPVGLENLFGGSSTFSRVRHRKTAAGAATRKVAGRQRNCPRRCSGRPLCILGYATLIALWSTKIELGIFHGLLRSYPRQEKCEWRPAH